MDHSFEELEVIVRNRICSWDGCGQRCDASNRNHAGSQWRSEVVRDAFGRFGRKLEQALAQLQTFNPASLKREDLTAFLAQLDDTITSLDAHRELQQGG